MGRSVIDLTGKKFGKLTVIKKADDVILPSGNRKHMWECKCECGNIENISGVNLRNGKITSCGCDKEINKKIKHTMSEKEKEDFDNLYQYVKKEIMGYDENQSLSKKMVLRLKGLSTSKFIENKNIKSMSNYSYDVILSTFKFCAPKIKNAIYYKSFKNDMNKFNYILAIVEENINDVYIRIKRLNESIKDIKNIEVHEYVDYDSLYKHKNKKIKNKYIKELW